jgi:lipopolysaccharide/colanic/teichoic acid biosynthesis glycosyltransferase
MQTADTVPSILIERRSIRRRADDFARRALDITAAGLGLLMLAPLFLILAIAIKRDTPGPVFYRGRAPGGAACPSPSFKFRTMYDRPASFATGPASLRQTMTASRRSGAGCAAPSLTSCRSCGMC